MPLKAAIMKAQALNSASLTLLSVALPEALCVEQKRFSHFHTDDNAVTSGL